MADNHVKPTSEELDANADAVLEELESVKEVEKEEIEEVIEEIEETEEEVEEVKEEETKEEESEDFKEKYIQSTREAQILYHKNKKISDAMDKANSIEEPTESDLKSEYTDWDIMSDVEKRMAKDSMVNSRRFSAINEVSEDFKRSDYWKVKVDKFLDDPSNLVNNPALEGKEDDFRSFSSKPSRRGLDFDDLIASFLYKADQAKPKKSKGKQLESVSTSDKPKPKSNKLSVQQGRSLRKTDYNKWKSMLKAGKIQPL